MRQRMLAVIRGGEHDRVPFAQYDCDTLPQATAFPKTKEVASVIGRENIGFSQLVALYRYGTPNCRFEHETFTRDGRAGQRRILHTPAGDLYEEKFLLDSMNAMAQGCRFVKRIEDYAVLLAYVKDIHVAKDVDHLRRAIAEHGEHGLPTCYVPKTPYQQLWVEWVDIEDLTMHLAEHPDLMQGVFEALGNLLLRVFETVCEAVREAPVSHLLFGENLTAPMIGEHYFRTLCVPAYDRLAEMLEETGKDVPVMVHADGFIRALWNAIGESRIRGLESLTPPPNGDTSVADALARWPQMRLLVNFPSSLHLAEPDEVYAATMEILQQGGRKGRLQIQISEDPPVGTWQKSYPAIVQAIRDFGPACGG